MAKDKFTNLDQDKFISAIGLLLRKIRSMAPPEVRDFSHTQKAILSRTERVGAMTTADLARAESVTPQSMGAAVASLENLGLVEKRPHPTDGRQSLIALSAKGQAMRKDQHQKKNEWLAESVATLSKDEQVILKRATEIIQKMAEL